MANQVRVACKKCGKEFFAPTKVEAKKKLKEHVKEHH
jgi:ribosomal protein S27E